MKKVALLLTSLSLLLVSSLTHAAMCDETFYGKLRAGNAYSFYDDMTNRTGKYVFVNNVAWEFLPQYNYGAVPTFSESSLVAAGHIWVPGETGRVINSSTYAIDSHPPVRSQNNLVINYDVTFSSSDTPDGGYGAGQTHRECKYYEITWCGDGIKDQNDGEACDGADGTTPGVNTCNSSCQLVPVEVTPPPACGRLGTTAPYATQIEDPITVMTTHVWTDLCAVGTAGNGQRTPANSANIWNNTVTQTWTCTSGTQTITCGATGPTPPPVCGDGIRNGNEQCDPNDPSRTGWGTLGCSNMCEPLNSTTNPSCDSITANPNVGVSGLTSTVTCATTNANTVSISCGNGTLATVGSSRTCNYSVPGTYSVSCTVNGTITSPACTTNVTVNPPTTSTFDLSLKKYIDTIDAVGDAQTAPGISKNTGNAFRYIIRVKNEGPANTSNTTTVRDTFPLGVNPNGNISAPGWSCDGAPVVSTITCTRSDVLASGQNYPDISVPVVVTATTGSVTNTATVSNPDENPANNYGNNNTDPAVFSVGPTTGFDLSIKKYVGDNDAQPGNAVPKNLNDTFNYIIKVKNEGPSSTLGETIVQDILPFGIASLSTPTGTGWTCSVAQKKCPPFSLTCINSGTPFTCSHTGVIAAGQNYPDITVPSQVTSTGTITNRAFVYNPNELNPCLKSGTPPTGSETDCTGDTKNVDPAVIIVGGTSTGTGFDLALKKYIATNDAQPGSGPNQNTNDAINYIIRVSNVGPLSTSGTTTVKDILPSGVTVSGSATGTGWTCTYTGASLSCESTLVIASGAAYPDITIPVRVTATANTTVTNYATVHNPNEQNPCYANNQMPVGSETLCTNDPKNNDPAQFTVPGSSCSGGGCGGIPVYSPNCTNGLRACSVDTYSSVSACESIKGVGKCFALRTDCDAANTYVCSGGPGGPSCTGPNCYPYTSGYCGDGVLQAGEECDVIGVSWCGQRNDPDACKMRIVTNPGANPITSLTISIPGFANILGSSTFLRRPFTENNIVVGRGANVFTLADKINLDVDTRYQTALLVPAERDFCLSSSGSAITDTTVCEKVSRYNNPILLNGIYYVPISGGQAQEKLADGTYHWVNIPGPTNDSVTLFRGADIPSTYNVANTKLRDTYVGIGNQGSLSTIVLFNKNPTTEPQNAIDLGQFSVKISDAMVGSTSSVVSRKMSAYFTPNSVLATFLSGFTGRVTTTSAISNSASSSVNVNNFNVNATQGNPSISTVSDLSPSYILNGNQNVYSVKGNVTISCPSGQTVFAISGVKTLIVDGNLTIRCNIAYPSGDTSSSWAFITKNGNIIIDNGDGTPSNKGITNIAGVYVAISGGLNTGNFIPLDSKTTTAILRLDGSMYGNANSLFQSRLYVRGTNAYDILTTGVILSYSNRALVNPPPLLSNFLNNYSVTRVVR